jgi:phosphatidylglycerol lysyltransferase
MKTAVEKSGSDPSKSKKVLSRLAPFLALGMMGLAAWLFYKTLGHYEFSEVVARFREIPAQRVAAALVCVAISYLLQTGYDYLALASLGRGGASVVKTAFAAFIANAFTNNIGLSMLTGPSIRYRFYSAGGFTPFEIAEVIAMTKLAFLNGLFAMAGIAEIIDPVRLPPTWPHVSARAVGFLCLLPAAVTFLWNALGRGSHIRFGRLRFSRPAQGVLVLQTTVACLHLVFAAFALYFLVPVEALAPAGFTNPFAFVSAFMAIKLAAMLIPVPGNLGVLEGAAVALLTPAVPDYPLLGGLLAYRLVYYLLPFALALGLMVTYESAAKSGLLSRWMRGRKRAQRNSGAASPRHLV